MKRGALVLVVTAIVSVSVYCIYFWCATHSVQAMLSQPDGQFEWLRREFALNDSQFTKITALHESYRPKCALMCQRITEANMQVDSLIEKNQTVTPEIENALKNASAVQEECRQAMLAHIYAVSAQMNPESGRRYLEMMRPRLVQPGLRSTMAISPNGPSQLESRATP